MLQMLSNYTSTMNILLIEKTGCVKIGINLNPFIKRFYLTAKRHVIYQAMSPGKPI